jgi:hypothetical protein
MAAFAAEATVGEWGDPQRLTIEGAKTFKAEEICKALFRDVHVLLASHSLAPRSGLAPAIEQRLLAGLLHAGFADAQVTARVDESQGRVIARIEEGPRYMTSGVRIEGAVQVATDDLHARLTAPYPPEKAVQAQFFDRGDAREVRWLDKDGAGVDLAKPVWVAGKPARFDAAARKTYHDHVRQALAELGYPFAEFDVSVAPNPATQRAELVVFLRNEGPPAEISDIEVFGAVKNSRAAILAHLEIKPGELITHLRRADLERRLWESGRFLEHRVMLIPPDGDRAAKMRIEVKEYSAAPPLIESLTREEAALLKTRRWLHGVMQGSEMEIAFRSEDEKGVVTLVLAPHRGLAATFGQRDAAGRLEPKAALLLSMGETGIHLPGDGFRLSAKVEEIQLTSSLEFRLNPEKESPFSLKLGAGVRSLEEGEQALPIDVAVSAAPVFFIGLAHEKNATASWDGEILTMTYDDLRLRIDSRDGRVLEWLDIGADGEAKPAPVRFASGEFARERDFVLAACGDAANLFRSEAPISSLIHGLCDERVLNLLSQYAAGSEDSPERKTPNLSMLRLLRKLAERDVLRPLDDLFAGKPDEKDHFTVPMEIGEPGGGQLWIGHLAVAFGLPAAEVLFPRDSWPWGLSRETVLTLAGRPNYLGAELQRTYASPETGPLSCLATAALLNMGRMPHAEIFAMRGLAELEAEDFLRDCRPLADPDAALGKCVRQCAAVLRALDESEIVQLSQSLHDDGPILEAAARELQRNRDAPLDETIPQALAAAWNAGLRERVKTALEFYLPEDTFRIGGR